MSISTTTRIAGPYAGNDAQTVFAYSFKVFATSDLVVTQADADGGETLLTLGVDYTATMNGDQDAAPGGEITLLTALPTGETVALTSDVPLLQGVQVTNAGGFFPAVFNGVFDRLTIFAQQLANKANRSLRVTLNSGVSGQALEIAALADGMIKFNADGDGFEVLSAEEMGAFLGVVVDPATYALAIAEAQAYADTNKLAKAQNLADVASAASSRVNLGFLAALDALWTANDAAAARTALALGTAALTNTGTGVGNVLAFAEADKLPALDGSNLTNVTANPSFTENDRTGAYTLVSGDKGKDVNLTNAADVTWGTLAAATAGGGWWCIIDNRNAVLSTGAGVMTLDPNGAETINGRSSIQVYPGEKFILYTDGANWFTLGRAKRVLVQTLTAVGALSVNLEAGFGDTEARSFDVEFIDVDHGSTGQHPTIQFKSGGAYVTSNYCYGNICTWNQTFNRSTAQSYVLMSNGSALSGASSGAFRVINPFGTTASATRVSGQVSQVSGQDISPFGGAWSSQNAAIQGVKITYASGTNATKGTFYTYINRD